MVERFARARADEDQAARSAVMHSVVHNLRSPLLATSAICKEIAAADSAEGGHVRMPVDRARMLFACCARMDKVIGDMIEFNDIGAGHLVLSPGPVRLSGLLEEAHHFFNHLATSEGITLVLQRSEPACGAEPAVLADRVRLRQCLFNGVTNALNFTKRGGTVVLRCVWGQALASAAAACDRDGGGGGGGGSDGDGDGEDERESMCTATLEVCDSGEGMAPEEIASLLKGEALARVGRGQLKGVGGTGLGLHIVRHLMALHGSRCRLALSSTGPGQGTTFSLHLHLARSEAPAPQETWSTRPMRPSGALPSPATQSCAPRATSGSRGEASTSPAQQGAAPPLQPSPAAPGGEGAGSADCAGVAEDADEEDGDDDGLLAPLRMLYVEDDVALRFMMAAMFDRLGVDFDLAEDGEQAVDMVRAARGCYDLVLMDNQMPRKSGTEATREMRQGGYTGLIVGLTSDPHGCADREAFVAAGLDESLDKDSRALEEIEAQLKAMRARRSGWCRSASGTATGPTADVNLAGAAAPPAEARQKSSSSNSSMHGSVSSSAQSQPVGGFVGEGRPASHGADAEYEGDEPSFITRSFRKSSDATIKGESSTSTTPWTTPEPANDRFRHTQRQQR